MHSSWLAESTLSSAAHAYPAIFSLSVILSRLQRGTRRRCVSAIAWLASLWTCNSICSSRRSSRCSGKRAASWGVAHYAGPWHVAARSPSPPAACTVFYLPSMSSAQFWDHFTALSDEERTKLTPGGLFILDWESLTMTLENLSHLEQHEGRRRLRARKNAHFQWCQRAQ